MASTAGGHGQGYDAALLSEAPQVDKKQVQEGYNADILSSPKPEPLKRTTDPSNTDHSPAGRSNTSLIPPAPQPEPIRVTENGSHIKHPTRAPGAPAAPAKSTKTPFLKTKKGLIILGAVLVAIIIAAVVGGVVGSRKSKSDDSQTASNASNNGGSNTEASAPGQGVGVPNGQDTGQQATGTQGVGAGEPAATQGTGGASGGGGVAPDGADDDGQSGITPGQVGGDVPTSDSGGDVQISDRAQLRRRGWAIAKRRSAAMMF